MTELLSALTTVVVGVGAYLAAVGVLYALTLLLPPKIREKVQTWVFLGPALAFLTLGIIVPAIRTTFLSLFTGPKSTEFVGLDNYKEVFTDSNILIVLRNNLMWAVLGTFFSLFFGVVVARLADRQKSERLAKALIFMPNAISLVGAGIIWKFMYATPRPDGEEIGLINQILKWLGITGNDWQYFMQTRTLNTLLMIVVAVWVQAGFATVVISAAIKGVPDSILEAARIDGATEWQVFTKVQLPAIAPTLVAVGTTTIITILKVFDIVRAMTGGNFDSNVIANEMYDQSFSQRNPGLGASLAVLLFVAVIPVVWVNLRTQRRLEETV